MAMEENFIRGKSGPWIVSWMVAVLLLLASVGSYTSQQKSPNLRPFQPEGWSDAIVISNRQDDNVDTRGLMAGDRLYVDFAVINNGGASVVAAFRIDLFINGQLWETFDVSDSLDPQIYRFRQDYPIGRLAAGTHTLRIVADAGNAVRESDESDNEYTKTISVSSDCFPLTTRVSPQGAGNLISSHEPNCSSGSATVGIGGLSKGDEDPHQELGIAGEPLIRARRARAFADLRAKVRTEGRVRVIVELKTRGSPAVSAVSRITDERTPSPLIAGAQQTLLNRMSRHDLSSVRQFKFIPYIAMEVDREALEGLAQGSEVVGIEEDSVVRPALEESTPLVGASNAWRKGYDGAGQTIAVLDSGVDRNHPFLEGKVVSEACYSGSDQFGTSLCPGGVRESIGSGSGMPCSYTGCFHGTAVAGIAAGKGEDFSGVAPEARIIAIQVFSRCRSGGDCIESYNSDWIAGLERVLELSASFDIAAVNMSFATAFLSSENCDGTISPAATAAIDELRAIGIASVAAAGNDESSRSIGFPACVSKAVSVGSTDIGNGRTTLDAVSDFSNSAPMLDLLAPGSSITTSVPGDGFAEFNGTSLSAPHVAGAWAVLKSKAPTASVPQLMSVLDSTGIPVVDPRNNLIKPRIQVDAALDRIVKELRYSSGTRVTLAAQPNPGFRFQSWRGCDSASENRCTVQLNSAKNIVASFQPLTADPDLVITSLVAPPTATIGGEVSISSGIRNQGRSDAGPFRLGFYLSSDSNVTTEDIWIAACSFDSGLPAGESGHCNRSFPVPPRVGSGNYFLGAMVDDLDQVAENSETNNVNDSAARPIEVLSPTVTSRLFVPVVLSAAGLRNSHFTSELTLTNRGTQEAQLEFIYEAHRGTGSGLASDVIPPGRQLILPDALDYLRQRGLPIPPTGNRIGTLGVKLADSSSEIGVLVRTATDVPEGRAGLAYPGIDGDKGFHEAVYLCGLRQNSRDRSNVALQNMGTTAEGPITLRTTVFSGEPGGDTPRDLGTVALEPGEFYQYSPVLRTVANGYVRVERVNGKAPFYAYGVINDQANSDGSFVFPVTASSLQGSLRRTLPVIVETNEFSSELTVTNFSEETKALHFSFVAEGLTTPDSTARFSLRLEPGRQRIIPDLINSEMRLKGVDGVSAAKGSLAGALFARVDSGNMSGIVIGARTSSSDGRGGRYGVFYNAVPDGAAFTATAWIDALQQNEENRSNLALVNTGEIDDSASVFEFDIYDGETALLVKTVTMDSVLPEDAKGVRLMARRWHQFNGVLRKYAQGTTQGYVRIRQTSGNNPFLAYGVVNDGKSPGQRSGDGAYVPARE